MVPYDFGGDLHFRFDSDLFPPNKRNKNTSLAVPDRHLNISLLST